MVLSNSDDELDEILKYYKKNPIVNDKGKSENIKALRIDTEPDQLIKLENKIKTSNILLCNVNKAINFILFKKYFEQIIVLNAQSIPEIHLLNFITKHTVKLALIGDPKQE